MNKNEAMIERLKGNEVSKCNECGEYVTGKVIDNNYYDTNLDMIVFNCKCLSEQDSWGVVA